jgi:hypothetical protein
MLSGNSNGLQQVQLAHLRTHKQGQRGVLHARQVDKLAMPCCAAARAVVHTAKACKGLTTALSRLKHLFSVDSRARSRLQRGNHNSCSAW